MPLLYHVALSIVVPTERIESANLHPATAQLFTWIFKESTDVSSDLEHIGGISGLTFWQKLRCVSVCHHVIVVLETES